MSQKKEIIALSVILIIGLIIVGFILHYENDNKVREEEHTTNVTETNKKVEQKEDINNKEEIKEDKPKEEQPNNNVAPSDTVTYSNKDKDVINTFSKMENDVDTLLKSGNDESIKDKAKGTFITLVDFIFYDGTINGITFNELTETGKAKVLSIASSIDEKIENKFPGYKETISDKASNAFKKASEIIKNGANNINNFAKEKLGDEYYQDIIASKDELVKYTKNALSIVGKVGSNLFTSGKDALNNWYQNFKNKQ